MDLFKKDDKPNRNDYDAKTIDFLNNLLQKSYDFSFKEQYDFADAVAKKIHDDKAKEAPSRMIRTREDFKLAKPFVSEIISEDKKHVLQTLVSYNQWDVVLNCFGTLQVHDKSKFEPPTFITVIGLALNAKNKGNLWRFIKGSCNPNCKFEECFIKVDGETIPSYFCSLMAIRDITVGEKLTVDINQMNKFGIDRRRCTCKEKGCLNYQKRMYTCRVADCPLNGKEFENAKLLQKHKDSDHRNPTPAKVLKFLLAQKDGSAEKDGSADKDKAAKKTDAAKKKDAAKKANVGKKFKCPEEGCDTLLSSIKILGRHMRTKHREDKPSSCKYCQKEFTREDHVRRHILCNNCPALKEEKKADGAKTDKKEEKKSAQGKKEKKEDMKSAQGKKDKKEEKKKATLPTTLEEKKGKNDKKAGSKKGPTTKPKALTTAPAPKPKKVSPANKQNETKVTPGKTDRVKKAPPPKKDKKNKDDADNTDKDGKRKNDSRAKEENEENAPPPKRKRGGRK